MTSPLPSPCRNVCRVGPDRRCDGCGRTIGEITRWIRMAPEERRTVMARVADWTPRPPDDEDAT